MEYKDAPKIVQTYGHRIVLGPIEEQIRTKSTEVQIELVSVAFSDVTYGLFIVVVRHRGQQQPFVGDRCLFGAAADDVPHYCYWSFAERFPN